MADGAVDHGKQDNTLDVRTVILENGQIAFAGRQMRLNAEPEVRREWKIQARKRAHLLRTDAPYWN